MFTPFEWHGYPCKYLPSCFQPSQLVYLILVGSNIRQLWEGKKYLPSLRVLDLSHSTNLIKMPDFGEVPNLEWLNLEGCERLEKMDPSIGEKLVYLNLGECRSLVNIPKDIFGLTSLELLCLNRCYCAFNTPLHEVESSSSESASDSQSTMSSIFKWITSPFRSKHHPTVELDMGICNYVPSCLSPSLPSFSCLRKLDISYCGVSQIPDDIGRLHWLEILILSGNNFVTLPSFEELFRLAYLKLDHCMQLKSLPELPSTTTMEQDHAFSDTGYWRTAGMSIFNCPELGEREHCSSMTFSWMKQFIQANQEKSSSAAAFFREIDIVILGNEIPRWFNNQSVGSSISIDTTPIMHDNGHNIIGIACCAVFSAASNYMGIMQGIYRRGKPVLHLCFQSGDLKAFSTIPSFSYLIVVESNYVWLTYIPRETFFGLMSRIDNSTAGNLIGMEVLIGDGKYLDVEVKKCGYSWVSKQDLQQFAEIP